MSRTQDVRHFSHISIKCEIQIGNTKTFLFQSVVVQSAKLWLTHLRTHGLQPTGLLCPWDFPGKKTRVGCQGSSLRLLHRQADSLPLNHLGALLFLLVLLKFSEVYSNYLWVLWKAGSDSGCLGWDFIFYASKKISQYSCSVMSDSLRLQGLQHARLPCPSPTLRACSNSCPSSRWCHPTISFVVPFSSF